jgi:hypothetical protein
VGSVRLLPLTLLAGVAAGVATVALYHVRWGLALAAVTVLALLAVAPRGWSTRLPYGIGFAVVVTAVSVQRGEGDFLIDDSVAGFVVLALATVVLVWSVATLPWPRRSDPTPGPE